MKRTVTSTDIHHNAYNVPVDDLIWRPSAYGIVIQANQILLTKQHGKFHLPGGGIELGESPEEAVVREIEEETGLVVGHPQLADAISGFFTWIPKNAVPLHYQTILLFYECEVIEGELSITGFTEREEVVGEMPEWISLNELDGIAAGSTIDWRGVVKKVLRG